METKICSVCGNEFKKKTKYCSRKCYSSVPKTEECRAKMSAASLGKPKSVSHAENISKGTTDKPKPYLKGDKNPNWEGLYSHDVVVHNKFLQAVKMRGQAWTDEDRKKHSQRMLGDSNAMRGKNHSAESKKIISETQKQRYKDGVATISRNKISKPEKEIMVWLDTKIIKYKSQFHILGISYTYDLYLPDLNLIIEFQGDYWHANPDKYPSGTFLKIVGKGPILVDSIWERDKSKKESAEAAGFQVKYIWESDYKKHGFETISCLIK